MNIKKLNEELEKVSNKPITEISVGTVSNKPITEIAVGTVSNEPITEIAVELASKVRDARRAREEELGEML